ncbi:scavenger receptor cysteine-rich domain superfamily protein-like [Mercenaria mercenaria]|uniref:scavenger receptor cysteine-rich domain superfamily protein-like n=1 Tax=Mercenaria mercenaria TaxID=6596 RepID=UPI00234F5E44|nr:scavenger receptor cysteine-rich domain superfamily protein-like [Mercenaria mercenaria]
MYLRQVAIFVHTCILLTQGILGADQVTQARLVGGSSNGTGRLELLYNGQWVTVYGSYSSSYFNTNDAKVACRMLGYGNSGIAQSFSNAPVLFGQGTGSVLNHRFHCRGNETDLRQCGSSSWSVSTSTSHTYDVGITCEPTKVRLADGDTPQSGRVEVYFKGQWSSICDTGFDNTDARVICNMLGYKDTGIAKAFTGAHFGLGSGDIIMTSLDCKGTETDIKSCSPNWGHSTCNHRKDAGVNCDSTPIRLENGPTNSSGRVEIYHGGHWGTICGNYEFDQPDVTVICKMLGFNNPNAFGYKNAFYGEGTGNVIISNMKCDGSESDIAQCQSSTWSVSTSSGGCDHTTDVGVNCAGVTEIRLVDGTSEQSGRVEIYHNGHWGTLSDGYFDNHDLRVICRMLGYEYSSKSFFMKGAHYGSGIGEIIATRLQCNGDEDDIGQCSAEWWPQTTSQSHDHDVGVNCDGVIPIKLVGGNSSASGRVELYHNGLYGTICSRSFDRYDLTVVCRMLGFDSIPKNAYWYPAASYSQGLGEIVVSDLTCNGIENSLGQCGGRWPAYSSCDHSQDVFVNCNGAAEKIRLVNGASHYSGRVEIFHSGQWATICDDYFDRADAVVICRMLKFQNPEKAVAYKRAHFGRANDTIPIVATSLHCNGLETNLGQCNPSWNPSYCSHSQDISVDCCPNCQDPIVGRK